MDETAIVVPALSPVKICIPSESGMVIAASPDGRLTCDIASGEARDEHWIFVDVPISLVPGIPDNRGFNIVSANFKLVMDYDPSTGEQVSVVPYNEIDRTHTIWHVSEDNEIYTYDTFGDKKYLWSVLGNVYVTPDEHLAETWKAVSMEGFDLPLAGNSSTEREEKGWSGVYLLIIAILALLIYLFRARLSGRR